MTTSVPKKANRFPLFVHKGKGYWCKTVLGKHHYFGKVADDPKGKEALKRWLYEKDWLLSGLEPPPYDPNGETAISVKFVCNRFMESKESKLDAGDLSQRTYDELLATCKFLMETIPPQLESKLLVPAHFSKILKAINTRCLSPHTRGKYVQQIRSIFGFAYSEGLIDRPTNFGADFKKPKQIAYRQHENAKGDQSLTASEANALLKHATPVGKAMILLGLQAGFSNAELAELPKTAIKGDWIEWPRAKTATKRRIPLWKETKLAIQAAMKEGKPDGELVFYRSNGKQFDRRYVAHQFSNAAKLANVENHTFYDLRRTFQTVAENHSENYDLAAIKGVMGHLANSSDMSARYRQNISDERLQVVTNAVRNWLFGASKKRGAK